MHVAELWRYPVKSLQGERLEAAELGGEGIAGDRRWALFDVETGYGLTARRDPALLFASAALDERGGVVITLPDGSRAEDDDALSDWLGRRVVLRPAGTDGVRRYENPDDYERDADWQDYEGAPGAFHDDSRFRVSLISTGSLGAWDRRRFRSNVLLEGAGEEALIGSPVRIGSAVVEVGDRIARCVMVTRPQPDGLERDLTVLRTVAREHDACLAVGGLVTSPGSVRVGDALVAAR